MRFRYRHSVNAQIIGKQKFLFIIGGDIAENVDLPMMPPTRHEQAGDVGKVQDDPEVSSNTSPSSVE